VILRDTTEAKEHEEELMRINLELGRSNNDLDDYTYAVSHDLKAPLRTIESFSSFLLEDHSDNLDDEGKEYLQRMILATKRMNALIQDLLLISRVGRLHFEIELVDLNELISEIVDDVEIILNERNGEIIYTKLPSIKTQKVWIKQAFSNLISNGLKFNESPNPRISIKCEEGKDHYILSVKDNGIGIDEKHHDKIFKIFQRLHTVNEYPGTGAGLTMCKKIVESMGGNISLDSKLGKGSTFYITIPKGSEISEESEPPYQSNDALSLVHENTNNEH
jgi:light-regulated signal transduction histidine kinase (bacteriophytochrome)